MKKAGIITLNGNNNYGNKLQHYAVQEFLKRYSLNVSTIALWNYSKIEFWGKYFFKYITRRRYRSFIKFDKKINYSHNYFYKKSNINIKDNLDFYIVGSDQVWNSTIQTFRNFYLLDFVRNDSKKISFSASFGIDEIPKNDYNKFENYLKKFHSLSVREDKGKEIIEDLTGRKDVEVLIDPTMLLTPKEWDKVSLKPKQIKKMKGQKYILNYFLGDLSKSRYKAIEKVALENNCKIINLLNKKDPFYNCGPSEFLYLEKNAFLICTDSFHSSVFAILYNRPFVVFERDQKNIANLSSRIDTLLKKFNLKNRKYNGKGITKDNLLHDYTDAYKILKKEREKSRLFIKKALNIEK